MYKQRTSKRQSKALTCLNSKPNSLASILPFHCYPIRDTCSKTNSKKQTTNNELPAAFSCKQIVPCNKMVLFLHTMFQKNVKHNSTKRARGGHAVVLVVLKAIDGILTRKAFNTPKLK